MKKQSTLVALSLLMAGLSQATVHAQSGRMKSSDALGVDSAGPAEEAAPTRLPEHRNDYGKVEKDLNATESENAPAGEEAVIETSHPYLLPRLFTLPTAYSLKSYEVRFGGQGNIQSTLANLN